MIAGEVAEHPEMGAWSATLAARLFTLSRKLGKSPDDLAATWRTIADNPRITTPVAVLGWMVREGKWYEPRPGAGGSPTRAPDRKALVPMPGTPEARAAADRASASPAAEKWRRWALDNNNPTGATA